MRKKRVYFIVSLAVLLILVYFVQRAQNAIPNWTTTVVENGSVSQIISVSGTMDAVEQAELSFPVSGTLDTLLVKEGDAVLRGTKLATLKHDGLSAEYQDAYASLLIAQADYTELTAGLRPEERDIARTKVDIATEELARVTREHDDRVQNAYHTLLSTDLEARPINKNTSDVPPTVSGTYLCNEGTYTLDMFGSGTQSGYSYELSGLETGTFSAYTETPAPMGTCGLSIQFVDGETYGNSVWTITIPNTESSTYVTNLNAYILAQTERENAIRTAEQNLALARQTEILDTANPRSESRARAQAKVLQAEARLEKIDAQIRDNVLTAPFDGVISHTNLIPGETVGTEPVLTLVSKGAFELTALVPEIDITKIKLEQKALIVFDARPNERLSASISFISPLAREIDGVSYFETKLILDDTIDWIQSGLNADVDIIIERHDAVLRIPKRFLIRENDSYSVLLPDGKDTRSVPITVRFEGNDGYVHVEGLNEGDTIIAP